LLHHHPERLDGPQLRSAWVRREHAQQIAAHESARTTKLYHRGNDKISVSTGTFACRSMAQVPARL
jgi:hypothetical protein